MILVYFGLLIIFGERINRLIDLRVYILKSIINCIRSFLYIGLKKKIVKSVYYKIKYFGRLII